MSKKEKLLFSAMLLFVLLPNILGVLIAVDLTSIGQRIVYALTSVALMLFGLSVFRRRQFFYAIFAFFPFWIIEIAHLLVNQATTSMLFIFTIVKSEPGEFVELFSAYWWALLLVLGIWGGFFYLNKRYIKNNWLLPRKVRITIAILSAVFVLVSVVGLSLRPKFPNLFNHRETDMRTAAWVGVEKAYPINLALDIHHLLRLNHSINIEKRNLDSFRFGMQPVGKEEHPLVVLLLGETSRYDHWQINGYERETSPLLSAREQEIVSFANCYSVANLTTVSVPFILSRATPTDQDLYMREKSVVDAFHEAGYRTAWIADQSFNNKFLRRIAKGCDAEYYISDAGKSATFVDTVLLPAVRRELAMGATNQMMVIHSLGCHFKYSSRYPDDFQFFMPDMKGIEVRSMLRALDEDRDATAEQHSNIALINNLRTILVNSYDNAIRFTDYFIDRVIRELEATGRPCVLVYLGDHGENLLDDERNMFLHGTFAGSLYEYHVPLFVWTSDSYRRRYPKQVAAMRGNQDKWMSTMNIFHSLLDLGDIHYAPTSGEATSSASGTTSSEATSIASPEMTSRDIIYGLDANMQPFVIIERDTTACDTVADVSL